MGSAGFTVLVPARLGSGLASVVSHKCCYTQCRPASGTRWRRTPGTGSPPSPAYPTIPSDGPVHLSITASCDQPTLPSWHGSLREKWQCPRQPGRHPARHPPHSAASQMGARGTEENLGHFVSFTFTLMLLTMLIIALNSTPSASSAIREITPNKLSQD